MIQVHKPTKRDCSITVVHLAPVLLVAVWGVAWIGLHASEHTGVHTLFQTLALTESVIALLFRRRNPLGALFGILVAYFAFELDPLLLPPMLIALFTVAELADRGNVLLGAAATAATVAALPVTGRASGDLAAHLSLRLLAVAAAAGSGCRREHIAEETPRSTPATSPSATATSSPLTIPASQSSPRPWHSSGTTARAASRSAWPTRTRRGAAR